MNYTFKIMNLQYMYFLTLHFQKKFGNSLEPLKHSCIVCEMPSCNLFPLRNVLSLSSSQTFRNMPDVSPSRLQISPGLEYQVGNVREALFLALSPQNALEYYSIVMPFSEIKCSQLLPTKVILLIKFYLHFILILVGQD